MSNKVFRPIMLWSGLWIIISIVILSAMWYQNKFYTENTIVRVQTVDFNILHAFLPYAIAFLEEHNQADLIQQVLNSNFGLFTMVYTDLTGKIKYQTNLPETSREIEPTTLDRYKSSYVYKTPFPQQGSAKSPLDRTAFYKTLESGAKGPAYGKLYLMMREPSTLLETLINKQSWRQAWHGEAVAGYFLAIITYIMMLVGFGAICLITAKYQTLFQEAQEEQYKSDLKARELTIRMLESSLNELNSRHNFLDQEYEKTLASSNEAQRDIKLLKLKLQSESNRAVELKKLMDEYQLKEEENIKMALSIDNERKKVTDDKREIEKLLQEGMEFNYYGDKFKTIKKNKPLQLWLKSNYNNLSFSKRAIQNIIDIQDSPGIFPSLPDALFFLNNISVDSILSQEGFPPKSITRYTQPLNYFHGYFFECRFSSDGRIFFGMSKTRVWNIDTILLKRRLFDNVRKHEKYLADNLGRDNHDLISG